MTTQLRSALSIGGLVTLLGLILGLFSVVTAYTGPLPTTIHRSVFVGLGLVLVFLLYPRGSGRAFRGLETLLALVAVAACAYVVLNYGPIVDDRIPLGPVNIVLGTALILVVLEAARRTIGPILPALAAATVLYGALGYLIPGEWGLHQIPYPAIIRNLYLSDYGIWGSITGAVATLVAVYIVFGEILVSTGGGDVFTKLAMGAARHSRGGAAQVSTISSAAFGTISGSAVANVVVDGVFTIPMMRRAGYSGTFAAAVEATASTGGQLVPPIMGTGAFIMAEFLGVPYAQIALIGVIPALLFYVGIWFAIEFQAQRQKIAKLTDLVEVEPFWRVISNWQASSPILLSLILLVVMMVQGFTPTLAAFYAIAICSVFYLGTAATRPAEMAARVRVLVRSVIKGGHALAMVAAMIACAQIIIGMLYYTGLASRFTGALFAIGGELLVPSLIMTAIVTSILGMGIPTTAAYVLAAAIMVGPLQAMGIPPLASHFFVFYFAVLSAITPPVCPAVYVAAGILGTRNWFAVAVRSVQIGIGAFVMPFMFVFSPALLLQADPLTILWTVAFAAVGIVGVAAAGVGHGRFPLGIGRRLALFAGFLLIVAPDPPTKLLGAIIVGLGFFVPRLDLGVRLAPPVVGREP